jgi:DNA-binding MurR/RpiR family transcriptional regulator
MMKHQDLSAAEKYTWEIIQEHYEAIPEISISKLAELAHCSISTINRTVKKKGFQGYAAFRFSIQNGEKSLSEIKGFSAEIQAAIAKNEEELLRTINGISPETIKTAVEMIDVAAEIVIISRGLSSNPAMEMLKKLQLFHRTVRLFDDPKYMQYYAKELKKESLLIAFSLTGETEEIIKSVKTAQSRGSRILAFTVSQNSSLSSLADLSLVGYKSPLEVYYFELDVHSRLPLFILVRILFDAYSIYKRNSLS